MFSFPTVPDGTLSLSIEDPQTEPALNWPFLLQCCASHSNQDIPTQPLLQWYKDGHLLTDNMMSTLGERQSCLSIGFTDLQDDQMGEYTCRASLQSSRMEEMLVKEESFELSVEQETETTTDTSKTCLAIMYDIHKFLYWDATAQTRFSA